MSKAYSLHLGLNSVNPAHYGGWSGDLVACENDARDMNDIARKMKYSKRVVLMTKQATRNNLVKNLTSFASKLNAGDYFLLTYSGHGGHIDDLNNDEDDGQDETWCLYDGQIIDDELNMFYSKFKSGVRIFVLSDSCHSGTVTRAAFMTPPGGIALNRREKCPSLGIARKTYLKNKKFYDKILKNKKLKEAENKIKARLRLISGCQDNQTSSDGDVNGLFTEKLLNVWNDGSFTGNYRKFYKQIINQMPPEQSPRHFIIGGKDTAWDKMKPFTY